MSQISASDRHAFCIMWVILSFVVDHLFQINNVGITITQVVIGAVSKPADAS